MSDSAASADTRVDVFCRFFEELETAADRQAVAARFAAAYPQWAADFRAEAAIESLVHAPPAPDEPFPTDLPDFHIVREVARGGMGVVYEARQRSLERRVALKVRRQKLSPAAQARFRREQEVLARLHQTHIVPIHTAGQVGPWQYFAMAYVEGAPLHHLVRTAQRHETAGGSKTPSLARLAGELVEQSKESADRGAGCQPADGAVEPRQAGRLPNDKKVVLSLDYFCSVARALADAAEALEHAHEKKVLHRDVKPSNLLLDTDGKCWVIDFGLAYSRNGAAGQGAAPDAPPTDAALTQGPLGTPEYMAPEQWEGRSDARTDVWGLGVTLYELLTLRPAFEGRTRDEVRTRVLAAAPTPPAALVEGLPADLAAICRKAMQPEPGRRYATAGAFAADLRRWLGHYPVQARPVWAGRRAWLWARRNPGWAAAILGALVSVITLAGGITYSALERERAAKRANRMLELERLRQFPRNSGWYYRSWEEIPGLARESIDTDLRNQAAATFIGLDARPIKRFEGQHFEGASSVAWDADGNRLLMGGTFADDRRPDGPAHLWDGKGGALHSSTRPGFGPVTFRSDGLPVQFVPDNDSWTFVLWDVAKRQLIREFTIPDTRGEAPKFSPEFYPSLTLTPDASRVAVSTLLSDKEGDREGVLVAWDVNTNKSLFQIKKLMTALAFSPDGRFLAAGDERGTITVWELPKGGEVAKYSTGRARINCLAFGRAPRPEAPGAKERQPWLLASGDDASWVVIWDLTNQEPRSRLQDTGWGVYAVAFNSDGTLLASGGRRGARLWDVATKQLILRFNVDRYRLGFISGLAFRPDGKQLAVSSRKGWYPGGVSIWDIEYGRGTRTLRGLSTQIVKVCHSPKGKYLAALTQDWQIGIWETAEGRLLHVLNGPQGYFADNSALAFNAEETEFVCAAGKEALSWDVSRGELLDTWKLPPGLVDAMGYHPTSGKFVLARTETLNGKVPPYDSYLPKIHPRAFRIRELARGGKLTDIAQIKEFNHGVRWSAMPLDASYVVVDGFSDSTGVRTRTAKIIELPSRKEVWVHPFQSFDTTGATVRTDHTGQLAVISNPNNELHTLIEMPSTKFLGSFGQIIVTRDGLTPGATFWHGPELFRKGDRVPLLSFDVDRLITGTSQGYTLNPAGTHLAWGNRDGTVVIADINEVRRQMTAVGLGW